MTTSTKAEQPVALEDSRTPFLRSIRANPDDDTPRLVYADWLQEYDEECPRCQGEGKPYYTHNPEDPCPDCEGTGSLLNKNAERAEFIRVQCELAEVQREAREHKPTTFSNEWLAAKAKQARWLRSREQKLFTDVNSDWSDKFTDPDVDEHSLKCWSRGFVSCVTLDWDIWLTHHAAILAHPDVVLEEVRLTTMPDDDWWLKETDLPSIGSGYIQDSHIVDVLSDRFRDPLALDRRITFTLPGEGE